MADWREQLAFAPLDIGDRGEEIARRLRSAIELGVLGDGKQLPSESELSARMGVSPPTLRAALSDLRHWGLIETKRGRGGGSFVRANTQRLAEAQLGMLADYSLEELRDIREYRAILAGSAAAAAAEHPHRVSIQRLASLGSAVLSAVHPGDMARADSQFHMELSAACRSVRLTRQEMAMQAEVGPLVWATAPERAAAAALTASEHAQIVEAISAGDATGARRLAEGHVRLEMNRLIDLRMSMDASRPGLRSPRGERAVAEVKALAAKLRRTAGESVGAVEKAVLSAVGTSSEGSREQLSNVYDVARRALTATSPALWALGFTCDPTFFGEAELIVCSAPSGPESAHRATVDWTFYDFSTAPWWPKEGADDSLHATGAFVDASGSNEYIVTFSKRVALEGRTLGVASADMLVTQLQANFEPLLLALPANTCILDQHGVVIATNTGSLIGETVDFPLDPTTLTALPGLPWQLCTGSPHPASLAGGRRVNVETEPAR